MKLKVIPLAVLHKKPAGGAGWLIGAGESGEVLLQISYRYCREVCAMEHPKYAQRVPPTGWMAGSHGCRFAINNNEAVISPISSCKGGASWLNGSLTRKHTDSIL
jgi:hypothetical protein